MFKFRQAGRSEYSGPASLYLTAQDDPMFEADRLAGMGIRPTCNVARQKKISPLRCRPHLGASRFSTVGPTGALPAPPASTTQAYGRHVLLGGDPFFD
jgi:hypothetical protein